MQVLFGAFQKTTISKNTLSHVSGTLKISVQLKKQILHKRIMYLANTGVGGNIVILLMSQITTWRTNHCLGIISSSL